VGLGASAFETPVPIDSDTSDQGLDDQIFNKELMKHLPALITSTAESERNFREEVFATGEKE
jgi:hypothetical protein